MFFDPVGVGQKPERAAVCQAVADTGQCDRGGMGVDFRSDLAAGAAFVPIGLLAPVGGALA